MMVISGIPLSKLYEIKNNFISHICVQYHNPSGDQRAYCSVIVVFVVVAVSYSLDLCDEIASKE